MGSFKILSIDGGGIRGVFPAHFLAELQRTSVPHLASAFDLFVGTSTGSIVAAAAALSVPMGKVVSLYEARGVEIFSRRRFAGGGMFRSKYQARDLEASLQEVFGDVLLGDVSARLAIPCTDISNGNVFVAKSAYIEGQVRDRSIKVVDAILASCAAPLYFDPRKVGEYLLADGGLWANNPSLVAFTEATGKLGISRNDLKLLSLGTGVGLKFYDPSKAQQSWGFLTGWKRAKLVDTILNLQSRCAENAVRFALQERLLRIGFEATGALPLDDTRAVSQLKARAAQEFTYRAAEVLAFLELQGEPVS